MGRHRASSVTARAQCRWSALAATQIKNQTAVKLLFKGQLGRQGVVYLHGQERVTDKRHTPEHKAGFQNLSVKEPSTHGFKGISGWFLLTFYIIFSIKLVSYCVTIANYHLCSAAVPKVAGNLLKPPLGQEAAPFHACLLFSQQHLNTDSYLCHTRRFVCCKQS